MDWCRSARRLCNSGDPLDSGANHNKLAFITTVHQSQQTTSREQSSRAKKSFQKWNPTFHMDMDRYFRAIGRRSLAHHLSVGRNTLSIIRANTHHTNHWHLGSPLIPIRISYIQCNGKTPHNCHSIHHNAFFIFGAKYLLHKIHRNRNDRHSSFSINSTPSARSLCIL